ncbi:hypothetical protein BD309DRAFT_992844 [Dichomitus squalens]|uniref:EF-hand domain-containing protein n=1 Tax=Dichomitus squalens TaxID=114155 RepID=A0A4Q9PZ30_9APHY|nr:hypothetical protein BD309DRAFT_992844 [Dichomitus squalens]TBU59594.1 hypothetical protein BD310DRAFT_924590 [Dichomitus squalens]
MALAEPKANASDTSEAGLSPEVREAKRILDGANADKTPERPDGENKQRSGDSPLETGSKVVDTASNSDGAQLLLDGVTSLVDKLPPFVKALEAVAQIHPVIAVAVGAFKVVIELEVKRRDNDKKVSLLFLEMRNMMSAFLQLQSVRADHVGRDGMTIRARLQDLVKRTANDIKECANVCDTYSKKRLLVKVLKGPVWDDTLKGFVQLFTDRKAEFNFAIAIHTGMAVDRANDKLDTLMTKMELILTFFERSVPSSQRTLSAVVEQAGGADAVLQRPDILHTLLDQERTFDLASDRAPDPRIPSTPSRRASSMVAVPGSSRGVSHSGFNYSRAAETQRARRRSNIRATGPSASVESPYGGLPQSYYVTPQTYVTPQSYATPQAYVTPQSAPQVRSVQDRRSTQTQGHQYYGDTPQGYGMRAPNPYMGPYTPNVPVDYEQEIVLLKQELVQAPAAEIKKNFEAYERKFEALSRELAEEMKKFVSREGDRVISSVLAGPHDRILDPDLYEIWKDMRWRGIVKARHLVLAIHDYYLQKRDEQEQDIKARRSLKIDGTQKRRSISEDDAWTLEYIDLMHLQPVIEALDEDASGYITIQEVNQFTMSRPEGWSLLHWLAYWAIGWQVCMSAYQRRIFATLDAMFDLVETARTANKWQVVNYLDASRRIVLDLTQSFQSSGDWHIHLPRFKAYMDREEVRLRESLETFRFEIDAQDTLALINGRKSLERNLFPLLYLLLSRHYDVMRLAQVHILHIDELTDAQESLHVVKDGFDLRRSELSALFQQRRLYVTQEIDEFACGMFASSMYDPVANVWGEDASKIAGLSKASPRISILKYLVHREDFYPINEDGLSEIEDTQGIDDSLRPIVGQWVAVRDYVDDGLGAPMLNVHFHPSLMSRTQVIAEPTLLYPWRCTRATIVGERISPSDTNLVFAFTVTFNTTSFQTEYWRLTLSDDSDTLTGESDFVPDISSPDRCHVVMKKGISVETMAFYPSPKQLEANRAQAWWQFAISAVRSQVRQRTISWARIKYHRDERRRHSSFVHRESFGGRLHPEDLQELHRLTRCTSPAELHRRAHVAVEPEKYAWILPPCSGSGVDWATKCGKLMKTTTPMLRCYTCTPEPGYHRFGAAFCIDDPACFHGVHGRLPGDGTTHCVLKTRLEGWAIAEDDQVIGEKVEELLNRIKATVDLLTKEGDDSPVEGPFSPHRLSTIGELTEDDITDVEERQLDSVASPKASNIGSLPPPIEDALFRTDIKPPAHEPIAPRLRNETSPSTDSLIQRPSSLSDTTIVTDSVRTLSPPLTDHFILRTTISNCVGCGSKVTLACWLCVDCPDHVFVCLSCDESEGGITAGQHKETHTLAQLYRPPLEGSPPFDLRQLPSRRGSADSDDRFYDGDLDWVKDGAGDNTVVPWGPAASGSATESSMIALGGRITRIEQRFGAVEDRLGRMEGMLEAALSLLRTVRNPQEPRGPEENAGDSSPKM